MQQKRLDQRVSTIRERGYSDAVNVSATRRNFGCVGQDQRPRHNNRPQTQYSSNNNIIFYKIKRIMCYLISVNHFLSIHCSFGNGQ